MVAKLDGTLLRGGVLAIAAVAVAGTGVEAVWSRSRPAAAPKGMVYSSAGFGGWVRGAALTPRPPLPKSGEGNRRGGELLQVAMEAYAAGRYTEAQHDAERVSAERARPTSRASRLNVRADMLAAYAIARQKNLESAREWFGRTREEAASLPDHGARPIDRAHLGQPRPSLEEEAAFQHAVCTGALGEKAEAQHEYAAFMRGYPESILVSAAAQRSRWLNGGDYPRATEAAWSFAERTVEAHRQARALQAAMCGPRCLAEVLLNAESQRRRERELNDEARNIGIQDRRRAGPRSYTAALPHFSSPLRVSASAIRSLAREMGTTEQGTSMEAMAEAARRHGLQARGLELTERGLKSALTPGPSPKSGRVVTDGAAATQHAIRNTTLIALVSPGHYVVVREARPEAVRVWDPDANGPGKAAERTVPMAEWQRGWSGKALEIWESESQRR